jgi:hypothetical protein
MRFFYEGPASLDEPKAVRYEEITFDLPGHEAAGPDPPRLSRKW